MQLLGRQPQIGETVNDQIAKHISIHQQGINVDVFHSLQIITVH